MRRRRIAPSKAAAPSARYCWCRASAPIVTFGFGSTRSKTYHRDRATYREAHVKRSHQRIITTHVGSLPRPDDLMALYAANAPDAQLQPRLRAAIADVVRRQSETDIDNDGEFGKAMRSAMDFGAWWSYVYPRLGGFTLSEAQASKGRGAWTHG